MISQLAVKAAVRGVPICDLIGDLIMEMLRRASTERGVVADGRDLLDQVLAGGIVPTVNGVGVVGHTRSGAGQGLYFHYDPPHQQEDRPASSPVG